MTFDEKSAHFAAIDMGYDSNCAEKHKAFEYGAKWQHSQDQKTIDELVKALESSNKTLEQLPIYNQSLMVATIEFNKAALEKVKK